MTVFKKIAEALGRSKTGPSEAVLSGEFALFERWIEATVGGPFIWRVRPRDDRENRVAVAASIMRAIRSNKGTFPGRDTFIERRDAPVPERGGTGASLQSERLARSSVR